jgi:hypothetical protein
MDGVRDGNGDHAAERGGQRAGVVVDEVELLRTLVARKRVGELDGSPPMDSGRAVGKTLTVSAAVRESPGGEERTW